MIIYSIEQGLKRSVRQQLRDSVKSTVLANAMARKEKFNCTEEKVKFRKRRKIRPKNIVFQIKKLSPKKYEFNNGSLFKTGAILNMIPTSPTKIENIPRLIPITKTQEFSNPKLNDCFKDKKIEKLVCNDLEKNFIKPVMLNLKKDKLKPKGTNTARKAVRPISSKGIKNLVFSRYS